MADHPLVHVEHPQLPSARLPRNPYTTFSHLVLCCRQRQGLRPGCQMAQRCESCRQQRMRCCTCNRGLAAVYTAQWTSFQ